MRYNSNKSPTSRHIQRRATSFFEFGLPSPPWMTYTFCQEMHQITQLLFADFFSKGDLGRGEVVGALEDHGLKVESIGRFTTFKYEDGVLLHVQMGFYPDERLHHVSVSIGIDGDEKGWSGWSKDREMNRLAQQEDWMRDRGITESSSGRLRISNTFSPQDGSSSITITTAEQAAP